MADDGMAGHGPETPKHVDGHLRLHRIPRSHIRHRSSSRVSKKAERGHLLLTTRKRLVSLDALCLLGPFVPSLNPSPKRKEPKRGRSESVLEWTASHGHRGLEQSGRNEQRGPRPLQVCSRRKRVGTSLTLEALKWTGLSF